MEVYHIWFNLKDGVGDIPFAESARAYLDHLKGEGTVAGYRITRRKLGLGPPQLPQWNITLDFTDGRRVLPRVLPRRPSREFSPRSQFHQDIFFALFRDFTDPGRVMGQEKF